jgi:cell wall-associated NlpC family hydrolase
MANTAVTVDEAIARGQNIINYLKAVYGGRDNYSQSDRVGANGHYDCSGFMGVIWKIPGAPATPSMVSVYTQHGFDHYKVGKVSLQRGDILVWNKPGPSGAGNYGHTAMWLGDGLYMESTRSIYGRGPQIGRASAGTPFQDILRGSSGVYITSFT